MKDNGEIKVTEISNLKDLPITINKEKKCLIQDGKEYPLTPHNGGIYRKYLEGCTEIGELSTVVLDI